MNIPIKASYRCSAPGKLILSGEHSVLYNCPALSLAIQFYSHCDSSLQPSVTSHFSIHLKDFELTKTFNFSEFTKTAAAIEQRYQDFKAEQLTIAEVLKEPEDLIICCLDIYSRQYPITNGHWEIAIESGVLLGRGLGSSASIIISLLKSLAKQHALALDEDTLLQLAKEVESRQHGKSSGLDPVTILKGGMVEYRLNQAVSKIECPSFKAWLIDTGKPESSTGEAVIAVQQHAYNADLWKRFRTVTTSLKEALNSNDNALIPSLIRENHFLLEEIGVVPAKVGQFIDQLYSDYNVSAKVCGSGAVKGNAAGIVLCFSKKAPSELCKQYGYTYQAVHIDLKGAVCTAKPTN